MKSPTYYAISPTTGHLAGLDERDAPEVLAVIEERARQTELGHTRDHGDGTRREAHEAIQAMHFGTIRRHVELLEQDDALSFSAVLAEEVWEALTETDPEKLRDELVQVAAVCLRWARCIRERAPSLDEMAVKAGLGFARRVLSEGDPNGRRDELGAWVENDRTFRERIKATIRESRVAIRPICLCGRPPGGAHTEECPVTYGQ